MKNTNSTKFQSYSKGLPPNFAIKGFWNIGIKGF